jgi:nucleoid-associated protein Lsr2
VAQRTVIELTDDLDGKPFSSGQGETVTFGLEGKEYEIDLSTKNAAKLRDTLAQYVSAGRRVGGGSSRRGRRSSGSATPTRPDKEQTRAIREWAQSQGYDVSARGRIPANIVEAYEAAH